MNLSNMTPAQQARALGLVVGDTIEDDGRCAGYSARLTLLWLGDSVAVWKCCEQFAGKWYPPRETSKWTLEKRDWVKISSEPPRISDEKANDALQQTLIKSCNYAFAHNRS